MARLGRDERLRLARECAASGMGVRDWCGANGVKAPTMYVWMRMLREEVEAAEAPAFVELAPADTPAAQHATPIVARVGAVEILLPPGRFLLRGRRPLSLIRIRMSNDTALI